MSRAGLATTTVGPEGSSAVTLNLTTSSSITALATVLVGHAEVALGPPFADFVLNGGQDVGHDRLERNPMREELDSQAMGERHVSVEHHGEHHRQSLSAERARGRTQLGGGLPPRPFLLRACTRRYQPMEPGSPLNGPDTST